jgi:putative ABC transport system permease protein
MTVLDPALPALLPAVAPPAARGGIAPAETLRIALTNLRANPLRTLLTALGVIIGVAAVVALLAIGRGTQEQIAARITANGANLLTIRAQGAAGGGSARLTLDDAGALGDPAQVPHARQVSPETTTIGSVVAGSKNNMTPILGVTPTYPAIHNSTLARGRWFTSGETTSPLVVLGSREARTLFGTADPVGRSLRINGQSFRVIGVLAAKGEGAFSFDDDAVFAPLAVVQARLAVERVKGAGAKVGVSNIVVQARDEASVAAARREIEAVLRTRHRVPANGVADDFVINNQQDLLNTLTETSRTMTTYLAAIAAISLLVGGIGIMNIMLVAVRERTREIGLRKAVGARDRDILGQFLVEALTLSGGGGLLGLGIGAAIAAAANATGQARATVAPESVLLAVGFALAVGLVFGIEPARRAARLDPIDALRYE